MLFGWINRKVDAMNDRELLDKAAKAAGLDLEWCEFWGCMAKSLGVIDGFDRETCWNPLTDDGDALRLAVKLGIQIDPSDEMYVFAGRDMDATELGYCECKNDDAMAAIRRAITRAAAAMAND